MLKILQKIRKGVCILWNRLTVQGIRTTALWAADHTLRIITGAPIRRTSQIMPRLHVGGQYRRRGWPRLAARGITAVVNLRIEFDDDDAGKYRKCDAPAKPRPGKTNMPGQFEYLAHKMAGARFQGQFSVCPTNLQRFLRL